MVEVGEPMSGVEEAAIAVALDDMAPGPIAGIEVATGAELGVLITGVADDAAVM